MTKKAILIIVVLLGAATALWYRDHYKQAAVYQTPYVPHALFYTDPQGVFMFEYTNGFQVSGRDGSVLARVKVLKSHMPSTNFSEAEFTITSTSGATDTTCSGRSDSAEAAAGNRYETTTIKKIYDGDCYVFEYIIHSTNIQNYDPSQGIKEFDKKKMVADLEDIVLSFKYLVNSD